MGSSKARDGYLSPVYGWTLFLSVIASWYGAYRLAFVMQKDPAPTVFILSSIPFFFILMFIEQCLILHSGYRGAGQYSATEFFTSLTSGLSERLVGTHFLKACAMVFSHQAIWLNYGIFDIADFPPFRAYPLLYHAFAFCMYDYIYYWVHRLHHTVGLLWAGHRVHHQAERYNLSAALRQSYVQNIASTFLTLPFALVMDPTVFALHRTINTIYQFWVHTCIVRRLPAPLEFLFSTPSHHRVHHDRRVHKNHGGVFIVWDRLHGTFLDEDHPTPLRDSAARSDHGVASAAAGAVKRVRTRSSDAANSANSAAVAAARAAGPAWYARMAAARSDGTGGPMALQGLTQDEDELFGVFQPPTSFVDSVTQFSGLYQFARQRARSAMDYVRGPGWYATVAPRTIIPAADMLRNAGIVDDLDGRDPKRAARLVDRYRLFSQTLRGRVGGAYLLAAYVSAVVVGFTVLSDSTSTMGPQGLVWAHLVAHAALLDGAFGAWSTAVESLRCALVVAATLPHASIIFPRVFASTALHGYGSAFIGSAASLAMSKALGVYCAASALLLPINLILRPFGGLSC